MNKILTPYMINNHLIKNRTVFAPVATVSCSKDGIISEKLLNYYEERAKDSTIGLSIIEHSYVHPLGRSKFGQISISKDEDLFGLKKLASIFKKYNDKVIIQITHCGFQKNVEEDAYDGYSLSPSPILHPRTQKLSKEMTLEEIDEVVESFKNAALRAHKAGFDGVQIHGAHGYLLNQFYSPLRNKRKDKYGGNLKNRIRIHLRIIQAIREALPKDFIISLRLGALDYQEGGNTLTDAINASIEFEKAGLDMLDISGGVNGYGLAQLKELPYGYFVDVTKEIKKHIKIPVISAGGFRSLQGLEVLIEDNYLDGISFATSILQDPHFITKEINKL